MLTVTHDGFKLKLEMHVPSSNNLEITCNNMKERSNLQKFLCDLEYKIHIIYLYLYISEMIPISRQVYKYLRSLTNIQIYTDTHTYQTDITHTETYTNKTKSADFDHG